jgi:hypothetical protein
VQTIEKIKQLDIKALVEQETRACFSKTNQLNECPFCGSGKGVNQSPAFSVNVKGNYFKCFSCGSGGSTIDFMMLLNEGWNEHRAIKYLQEKYLGITSVYHTNNKPMSAFDKTLFAIKNNPIDKASTYIKARGINTKLLPSESYLYDSHANAIVFVDAKNQLINRRMIQPQQGKPKAKNQGLLNESIYDKLFKPQADTVFIHEGVINALSMPEYSSIALFSSENKVRNTTVLRAYTESKHIVLAMDNDKAGNKCAEYYRDFLLSNRFNIQSLRRLVFPEKEDANDLLQNGSLGKYIKDQKNYQLLWEDVVSKRIPKESKDKQADNEEYYFFMQDGCYYMKETIKGKPIVKKLSNFLMESVYHLMDGTKESRRLVKFQRNTGEITVNEILSSELNLDRFKKVIRSISSRGLTFFGNTGQLDHILTYMYDREKNAITINQLGYQHEHNAYCFADAVITIDNTLVYPDKLGIISHNEVSLYLPPFAYTNLSDKSYSGQRKFTYKAGNLNFNAWADLIYKAYGINGAIGISFIILALYRDYILELTGFFPFLFLFGDQGAGKSNFVNFFLHLFGEPNHGISLLNSTDKGFSRSLTQRSNALYYLKEYTNAIDKKTVDVFKTGYDGELYTMAQKSNDNKTTTLEISSACMVDGNELPTSEAALFARMIVLHFEDNKFSEETTEAHKTLLKEKEQGFCNVTRELLKHRNLIETKFKTEFNGIFQEIKTRLSSEMQLADRQIRHIALLLTPVKLLQDKFTFPFDFETYKESVIENMKKQDEMASDLKDVSIFWSAIAYKIADPYSGIREGSHYIKDSIKKILYIKFKLLYPCYADYVNKNKLHFLEMNSLRELLTAKGNKSFIPNTSQKSRNVKSYTHKTLGSCYMFKYESLEDSNVIMIDGVELNI